MTNAELDRARAKEALRICDGERWAVSIIAARLAREGWTPPVVVDPDIAEAAVFENRYYAGETIETICLQAIKRGRELERAEAKPGLVWVKHDGSNHCPVDPDSYVWIKRHAPFFGQTAILMAGAVGWPNITHYAIITPPAEDVA